jgi:hypothetical protein
MDTGVIFDRHYFGPFAAGGDLQGPNGGMIYCADGKLWKAAKALIGRVWPLITSAAVIDDDNENGEEFEEEID